MQVQDVIQDNTPEELTPLIDALERAKRQQEEATGIREALEAEVSPLPFPDIMPSTHRSICLEADQNKQQGCRVMGIVSYSRKHLILGVSPWRDSFS